MITLKTMSYQRRYLRPLFLLPLFVTIMLGSRAVDCLAEQVAATLHQQGPTLSLEISVVSPPPTNLIAIIKLPPKTKIVATSPQNAKLDPKKSEIKWLVKTPSQGVQRFSATSSKPTEFSKVSAEILYRKPSGGKLVKIDARKR